MEQVLIKIGADLSAFDKRLKEAEGSIDKLQNKAQQTSGFKTLEGNINRIGTGLLTAARQTGTFLGVAWGLHGAFHAIEKAVTTWVSVLKTGLTVVDEFKMGVVTSSGMLTALSQVSEPELGKAYGAWKEYHEWLYRASLETDRKVAASGQDIFEAGKELALRGLVPKTKDQVYVTGMLVDWIRSVTKGLSQQQQLWQEVRALFEGQMRLGAQALQQFVKVDPQFREKFEEARKAAMALGDAQPVWDLLEKTMRGMKYAGKDMEMTLNSLQNTAKSAINLGLIETFSEAYESLVKYGWQVLDTFYQNGQLTAQGQEIANQLKLAWEGVKPSVDQLVNSIVNGGPAMAAKIGQIAAGLANITVAAANATAAVLQLVSALGSIDVGGLLQAAAIAGGFTIGGGVLGGLLGGPAGAWAGAKGGALVGTLVGGYFAAQKGGENAAGETLKGIEAQTGIHRDLLKADMYKSKEFVGTMNENRAMMDYATEITSRTRKALEEKKSSLERQGMKKDQIAKELQGVQVGGPTISEGGIAGTAKEQYLKAYTSGAADKAPPVPKVNMGGGKAPKGGGKGGGAERKPVDYQLWLQEAKAKRDLAIAQAEFERDILKKENDNKEKEMKRALEQGLLSYQEYYAERLSMLDAEQKAEKKILDQEIKAIDAAHEESVTAIKRKAEVREYTPEEMNTALRIEELKYQKEKVKIAQKIKEVEIDGANQRKQLIFDQNEALRKQQQILSDLKLGLAWGPLEERAANVAKVRQEYANQRKGFKEGTEEYNQLKSLEEMAVFQAKFKEQIDGFVNVITGGLDGIVDSLMNGGEDLIGAVEDMFTGLFKEALKPGVEWLQQQLTNLFKQLFSDSGLGAGFGTAIMGAVGLAGMMLTKSLGTSKSSTPSGVTSNVTTHEAVRGVVAGEQSIAIGEISVSIREAFLQSESYLREIAINTRNLSIQGGATSQDMNKYYNDQLAKGV